MREVRQGCLEVVLVNGEVVRMNIGVEIPGGEHHMVSVAGHMEQVSHDMAGGEVAMAGVCDGMAGVEHRRVRGQEHTEHLSDDMASGVGLLPGV